MRTDYGRFSVEPYTPHLGADVLDVDLASLDDELISLIEQAWLDWKVLFFHDQDITSDQHKHFALQFGEIDKHPYLDAEGEMAVIDQVGAPDRPSPWHTDATFRKAPPYASFLIARVLPSTGGDTCFGNMEQVYEGLSDEVKEEIEGRTATHSVRNNFARALKGDELAAELERFPPQQHPVVRTHPVTKRRGLFVSDSFTDHIDDIDPDEGHQLLEHLIAQTHRPEYQMRFRWKVNSMAMWDNRCTQHAPVYDYTERRRVERFTLAGEPVI